MNVKGVKKAAIIDKKGNILKGATQTEKDSLIQALSYLQVEKISVLLKRERPKYISFVSKTNRTILKEYEKNIIFIDIEPRYQLEMILPFIDQVVA